MATVRLELGNCIKVMASLPDNSVDSIVCDPPYGLEFMGEEFDSADGFRRSLNDADTGRDNVFGRSSRTSPEYKLSALFQEFNQQWATEALRILKPGGHLLAFGAARTYHRLACAVEDAGFEIRESLMWIYGSGMPKSHNLDRLRGTKVCGCDPVPGSSSTEDAQWPTCVACRLPQIPRGMGTALKPAHEPIVVGRKPLIGTVAVNVLTHGTGALNIDVCRVGSDPIPVNRLEQWSGFGELKRPAYTTGFNTGRWPANVITDGSDEVVGAFPEAPGQQAPVKGAEESTPTKNVYGSRKRVPFGTREGEASADRRYTEHGATNFAALPGERRFDTGSAARFFYCAKPSKKERGKTNDWPTVKPITLMAYLCKLVTPPGGTVVDPFLGSGTTGIAAIQEGFDFIGIDSNTHAMEIARTRIGEVQEKLLASQLP